MIIDRVRGWNRTDPLELTLSLSRLSSAVNRQIERPLSAYHGLSLHDLALLLELQRAGGPHAPRRAGRAPGRHRLGRGPPAPAPRAHPGRHPREPPDRRPARHRGAHRGRRPARHRRRPHREPRPRPGPSTTAGPARSRSASPRSSPPVADPAPAPAALRKFSGRAYPGRTRRRHTGPRPHSEGNHDDDRPARRRAARPRPGPRARPAHPHEPAPGPRARWHGPRGGPAGAGGLRLVVVGRLHLDHRGRRGVDVELHLHQHDRGDRRRQHDLHRDPRGDRRPLSG